MILDHVSFVREVFAGWSSRKGGKHVRHGTAKVRAHVALYACLPAPPSARASVSRNSRNFGGLASSLST